MAVPPKYAECDLQPKENPMTDVWLTEERERFGRPVNEDDVHAGYDLVLDAVIAARQAAKDQPAPQD